MSTNTAAMYALLEQARQKNAANKLYRLDMFDPVSAPASTSVPAGISTAHSDGTGVRSVRETSVAPEGFASDVASRMGKSLATGALGGIAMGGTGIPSGPGVAKNLASSIMGASNLAESITGKKALGYFGQAAVTAFNTALSIAVPELRAASFVLSPIASLAARAAFGDDLDNSLARGFGYSDFGGVQSRMDNIGKNVFGDIGDPFDSSMYGNPKSYMDTLADGLFGDPSAKFGDVGKSNIDGPPGGYGDYGGPNAPSDNDEDGPDGPDTGLQGGGSNTDGGSSTGSEKDSAGNTSADKSSGVGHGGFGDRNGSGIGGERGLGY